jgi:hypothetical protein
MTLACPERLSANAVEAQSHATATSNGANVKLRSVM